MRRYRAMIPSMPGRWRTTREIAKQDAIRAGFGSRDAMTGIATINPAIRFEIADGDVDCAKADLLEGDALAILVVHGEHAEAFARSRAAIAIDTRDRDRWLEIASTIEILRFEARHG